MRVLFIHSAKEPISSPEYTVHRILADNVDPRVIDCRFIWQEDGNGSARSGVAADAARNTFYDFGRNMSPLPRWARQKRALAMVRQAPGALSFVAARINQFHPDVIYTAQQRHDVRLGRLFAWLCHKPHVIHIHYPIVPSLGWDVVQAIHTTPHLIAVSEFIRSDAIQHGIKPAHIRTVWNPTPFTATEYQSRVDRKAIRAQFNLRADAPLVVAAGRLDPSKGHRTLLDAFARVHVQLPDAHLLVCGVSTRRDDYEHVLRDQVAALGLGSSVIFAGQRRDVPAILAAADVFCLPTEREAFGLVFLEAMAASLPIVACDSGGVPEIVHDGETGFLTAVGDVGMLAERMLTLLTDKDMAGRFGAAGLARCRSVFAPARIAAQWAEGLTGWFANDSQRT